MYALNVHIVYLSIYLSIYLWILGQFPTPYRIFLDFGPVIISLLFSILEYAKKIGFDWKIDKAISLWFDECWLGD